MNSDIHGFQVGVIGHCRGEIGAARVVAAGGVTEVVIFLDGLTIVGSYRDKEISCPCGSVWQRERKRLMAGRVSRERRVTTQGACSDVGQTVVRIDSLHEDVVIESTADGRRADVFVVPANRDLIT